MKQSLPHAPATQRNKDPILNVLKTFIPSGAEKALEIASGTGEHICFFAEKFPSIFWQPSDRTNEIFWAIKERGLHNKNQKKPILLDVNKPYWHNEKNLEWDLILCINMIHITSWQTTINMLNGASQHLKDKGVLCLYGPYCFNGDHTSQSNLVFDRSLRTRNPTWGVRHFEDIVACAEKNHLSLIDTVPMPANNFSLIFAK